MHKAPGVRALQQTYCEKSAISLKLQSLDFDVVPPIATSYDKLLVESARRNTKLEVGKDGWMQKFEEKTKTKIKLARVLINYVLRRTPRVCRNEPTGFLCNTV